jgi:bifunctional non-homologous end joining protein LigD
MESLAREVSRLPAKTAWLDGEVVVLGDDGVPNFNALQNAFDSAGTEHITYFAFDVLYLNGKDLRSLEFRERRAALEQLFANYDQDRVRLSQTFTSPVERAVTRHGDRIH